MAHPLHHAISSVKRWGGEVEDYMPIHNFLDSTKAHMGDIRHRALLHNTWGIFLCEKLFGISICNSKGRDIPVRVIAEKHVVEDCGFIPSVSDWLKNLQIRESWMRRVGIKNPHLNSGEGRNGYEDKDDNCKREGGQDHESDGHSDGDNGHRNDEYSNDDRSHEEDQAAEGHCFSGKVS